MEIMGSPRLPPIQSPLRAESARGITSNRVTELRGGGRLFIQSPIQGYNESEMVREAQLRIEHNKQRMRLKRLLRTTANGGEIVNTRELALACELAKMPLGADRVNEFAYRRVSPALLALNYPTSRYLAVVHRPLIFISSHPPSALRTP